MADQAPSADFETRVAQYVAEGWPENAARERASIELGLSPGDLIITSDDGSAPPRASIADFLDGA